MTTDMPRTAPYHTGNRRARLLIVDDQPSIILYLSQIFTDEYEVFMAKSGEQALAFCHDTPPDLVLTDVMMPGMSGLELCKKLKQQPDTASIPVIFVSGNQHPEDETACWNAGGVDFVNKPVNPITLRNRVRSHLALKFHADQVHDLAFLDGLTGVANRRYFDDRLAAEWRHNLRSGAPLALILVDIDDFKRLNEQYGHQAGDDCLRRIAAALKEALSRPSDLLARYDGAAFACLLPETPSADAIAIADLLQAAVRSLHSGHQDSGVAPAVTISLGIAACLPDDGNSAASLLETAHANLLLAKQQGYGTQHAGAASA